VLQAFVFASSVRAHKTIRRNAELENSRLHVPVAEQRAEEEPPILIAVAGPPGVGKSTLISSLVKHYTKQNLTDVKGPITVVSGKARRLTFVECANNLAAMVDLGKTADLVLLLVDASVGFELETFEMLQVLQAHGMPRVMGVLSHLDRFKARSVVLSHATFC
jgi:ribosome biogenesis protein BMS1